MPLTPTQRELANTYLTGKLAWSAANDAILSGVPRSPVPHFPTPEAAVGYYQGKGNPYTGDPLYGALDFYTNPTRLAYALEVGPEAWKRLWIDCDDVAGFYLAACRQMEGVQARIVTLIDAGITGSHVVCVGTRAGQVFAMDTNGFHVLPDAAEATLCAHWNQIYKAEGYSYLGVVDPTPYPF